MTFKEKLTKTLVDNGLFQAQAEKVMENLMTDEHLFKNWNDDSSHYWARAMFVTQ